MSVERHLLVYSGEVPKKYLSPGTELNSQKAVLWKQVIETLQECEKVWKSMEQRYNVLNHMLLKQAEVKNLCLMFTIATRQPCIRSAIKTPKIFSRIEQQGQTCLEKLEVFHEKATRACDIINKFNRDMEAHSNLLMPLFPEIDAAKSLNELSKIQIPSSDWIQRVPDPEIDALTTDWNKAQLHSDILHALQQLSQIVPGYIVMDLWKTVKLHRK